LVWAVVRAILGERAAGRTPIHIDVLHADQPCTSGFGSSKHPGLQTGELSCPLGVRRIEGLIDHARTLGDSGGELGITGVAGDDLDLGRHTRLPGTVDEPDTLATPS
jgi:hypothetical protein